MKKSYKVVLFILILSMGIKCERGGARVGLQAPPLVLERVGGGQVDLTQLKGKVVLVNFWATWCEPCMEEMPGINEMSKKMEGKDFELLAVSVDEMDKKVEKVVKEMNLTFPVLRDPGGRTGRKWGTVTFPETYIVGPDGILKEKIQGMIVRKNRETGVWETEEIINIIEKLMPVSD